MVGDICIRCTEDLIEDDPSYDASQYTEELSQENIKHKPDDQVCITCANQYEHQKWLKEATKGGPDCESNEQALQVLKEEELLNNRGYV